MEQQNVMLTNENRMSSYQPVSMMDQEGLLCHAGDTLNCAVNLAREYLAIGEYRPAFMETAQFRPLLERFFTSQTIDIPSLSKALDLLVYHQMIDEPVASDKPFRSLALDLFWGSMLALYLNQEGKYRLASCSETAWTKHQKDQSTGYTIEENLDPLTKSTIIAGRLVSISTFDCAVRALLVANLIRENVAAPEIKKIPAEEFDSPPENGRQGRLQAPSLGPTIAQDTLSRSGIGPNDIRIATTHADQLAKLQTSVSGNRRTITPGQIAQTAEYIASDTTIPRLYARDFLLTYLNIQLACVDAIPGCS